MPLFDTALPELVNITVRLLGAGPFVNGSAIVVRDAAGVMTLVLRSETLLRQREDLSSALHVLGPYVDTNPVATPAEMLDEQLLDEDAGFPEKIALLNGVEIFVNVVDRRIVGSDWQRPPAEPLSDIPICVFWSLKGGVGRSTALCVSAAELAREGLNVLAVDLDLEAPGLSSMLLDTADRPYFGALDYFAESGIRTIDDDFIRGMVGPSRLSTGRGLVSVLPASGIVTDDAPQNMMAKLARSYVEKPGIGTQGSFLDQTREMLQRVSRINPYDVIFVDARAGMNESAAASILGLGGTVLLFGIDTPQTFQGYRYLLSHMTRFLRGTTADIWRERLQMVHAKASASLVSRQQFRNRAFDIFSEFLYEEAAFDDVSAFNFDLDDETAPHFGWPILHDSNFLEFDPLVRTDLLGSEITSQTFGDFTRRLADRLGVGEGAERGA